MEKYISSRDNKIIKQLTALQKRSGRTKHSLFIAEGRRICDEAVMWANDKIEYFVASETFYNSNKDFFADNDVYILKDDLFDKISDTQTPQGVICVLRYGSFNSFAPCSDNILILDGVSEPGNMGTILRTAEAMGFYDVFILKGSADIYSPKVIRSTMGAVFRLNFHFEQNYDFVDALKKSGYKIITTALSNSVNLDRIGGFDKTAIVIGNEAVGVSDQIIEKSDLITKIEMTGNAESLNAAVAAGIVMYKFSKRGE